MLIKNFCDVLQAYQCIGNWFVDTSLFDGPPTCEPLNEYKDAFCPDDSFTKWYYAMESFNNTLNAWWLYPGTDDMFSCFRDLSSANEVEQRKLVDWLGIDLGC